MLGCAIYMTRHGDIVGKTVYTFCWNEFQEIVYLGAKGVDNGKHVVSSYYVTL